MLSLAMESLDMLSFDIVSFCMDSWAWTAGATPRPNDKAAAEIPKENVLEVQHFISPLNQWQERQCRY